MADDIFIHPAAVTMVTPIVDQLKAEFKAKLAQDAAVSAAYLSIQSFIHAARTRQISFDGGTFEALVVDGTFENSLTMLEDAFPHIFTSESDADPGDMDGDHASALASAGMGTDEDYGGGDGNEHF